MVNSIRFRGPPQDLPVRSEEELQRAAKAAAEAAEAAEAAKKAEEEEKSKAEEKKEDWSMLIFLSELYVI